LRWYPAPDEGLAVPILSRPMTLDPTRYPILIVDDEQDNLDAFRFNFRRVFSILSAQSGPEALEILRETDVAVIVTDQRMPRMTGLELLREAERVRPDAVGVILTAFTDVDVLIEAISLGQIYRYITKPWEAKEVRGVLLQALERYHLRRENQRLMAQLQEYTGYLNSEIHGAFDFGNIIGECSAYFGAKDAQQLRLVKRMATDLNMPVEVVACPTVREPDGLALSSRNVYLSKDERKRALVLSRALFKMEELAAAGEDEAARLIEAGREVLAEGRPDAIDYLEIVDPDTLEVVDRVRGEALVCGAIRFGGTRLLDNAIIRGNL
jgi:CheY-like chemotaxis protein